MRAPNDTFWDELGVKWAAIDPDVDAITPRLKARLRRQSRWFAAGFVGAGILSVSAFALGLVTMWIGWRSGAWHFITRGLAIVIVSLIVAGGARLLRPAGSEVLAGALSEVLDLAIQRARRMVLLVRLGLWGCGTVAAFGLVGTAIRSRSFGPPRMSVFIDLILLGLFATVLYLCGRQFAASVARYELLRNSLIEKDGARRS